MNSVNYVTVDVFTRTRFAGNPLAVIPDARGLSDAQMQSIAAEFNYSESTFILPPDNAANTARVRLFTPTERNRRWDFLASWVAIFASASV